MVPITKLVNFFFGPVIKFVRRFPYFINYASASLIPMLLVVLVLSNDHRSQKMFELIQQYTQPEHTNLLSSVLTAQTEINYVLKKTLTSSNASRAFVYEFHNGTNSIVGIPFARRSSTYEVVADDVVPEINRNQNLSIRDVVPWLQSFLNQQCVHEDSSQRGPDIVIARPEYRSRSTSLLIACPIIAANISEPIGYVGIVWYGSRLITGSESDIERMLRGDAVGIATALLRVKGH